MKSLKLILLGSACVLFLVTSVAGLAQSKASPASTANPEVKKTYVPFGDVTQQPVVGDQVAVLVVLGRHRVENPADRAVFSRHARSGGSPPLGLDREIPPQNEG